MAARVTDAAGGPRGRGKKWGLIPTDLRHFVLEELIPTHKSIDTKQDELFNSTKI